MSDFIINLGKKNEKTEYDSSKFQGEINEESIQNEKHKSIFLKLSNNKNILTEDDIKSLNDEIQNADSNEDGVLSNKEAKSLIDKLGLGKVKVKDFYSFLLEIVDIAAEKYF